MKICQFVASAGTGGLERHVIELCNELSQRHEVTFIGAESFRPHLDARVRFETFPASGSRYSPRKLWRLYRILRRTQAQIIHAQANKAAAMVRILRPLLGARTVATIHNRKRSTRAFSGYDWVIGVSGKVAMQVQNTRRSVIFNGVVPGVQPAPEKADGIPLTVLAVGRLVPAKGFDLLLDAWRNVDAPLDIAGDGPERHHLERLIGEYGLRDRVRLLGFRSDVAALLTKADLVVISSRREGFPYVLVEALHAKAIVLSTPVPGAVDVLPPEAVLSADSAHGLSEQINRALADLPGLRACFEPVWKFAQQELTVAAMTEKTESVYANLLRTGSPRARVTFTRR